MPIPHPAWITANGRRIQVWLLKLSMTGGLARSECHFAEGAVGEIVFDTDSGTVRCAVAFLPRDLKRDAQPFRFLSLEESNQGRLRACLDIVRAHAALRRVV